MWIVIRAAVLTIVGILVTFSGFKLAEQLYYQHMLRTYTANTNSIAALQSTYSMQVLIMQNGSLCRVVSSEYWNEMAFHFAKVREIYYAVAEFASVQQLAPEMLQNNEAYFDALFYADKTGPLLAHAEEWLRRSQDLTDKLLCVWPQQKQ